MTNANEELRVILMEDYNYEQISEETAEELGHQFVDFYSLIQLICARESVIQI